MGVESTVLLRNELLAVAPYLGPHVIGGSFLKGEGFANPLLVTPAHTKAAQRHGARFFSDAPVRSIAREKRWRLRDRDRIAAPSAPAKSFPPRGAWTAELGRMVGLKIPVTGGAGQVIVTEGRPPIMLDHLLQHVGKGLTLKQSRHGTFIIGGGWPGHYDRVARPMRAAARFDRRQLLGGRADGAGGRARAAGPGLVGHGLGRADGLPIIGESSAVRGFHVLYAPLGFTMGPICGRVFAENFLTGDATVPVAPYTPDRFQ